MSKSNKWMDLIGEDPIYDELDVDLTPFKTFGDTMREEWLKSRLGVFTASQASRLVTCRDKDELPRGALTYIDEKVVETLTGEDNKNSFKSAEMEWGNDHEDEAVNVFENKTNIPVLFKGDHQKMFTKEINGELVGATPDGVVEDFYGVEVKCPTSAVHYQNLLIPNELVFKKLRSDYYWQICQGMLTTGLHKWNFVSYDPRFKNPELRLKVIQIFRDEKDIDFLRKRLSMAIEKKRSILNEISLTYTKDSIIVK